MSEARAPGGFFKPRNSNGTTAPGAQATQGQQAQASAPTGLPVAATEQPFVASASPQVQPQAPASVAQPAVQVVQSALAAQPAAAPASPAAQTALVPAVHPTTAAPAPQQMGLAIPAELAEELNRQLALAGFNPDDQCGLLDMGGVHESLGSSLPIVRIEYAKTDKAAQAGLKRGKLTNMATLEQSDALRLVLLSVKLQRLMWPEEYDQDHPSEQPLCASMDGKTSTRGEWCDAGTNGLRAGIACAGCSFAQWRNVAGKRKKPLCAEIYTMLCIDRDAQAPVIYGAKRSGVKPFKAAYAQVNLKAMRWGIGLPNALKQCSVGLTLRPAMVKDYFVPEFGNFEQIPAEEVHQYSTMLLGLLPMFAEADISKEGAESEAAERAAEAGEGAGNGYAQPADTSFGPPDENSNGGAGQGGYAAPGQPAAQGGSGGGRKF